MRATPNPACLHDLHDFLGSEARGVRTILDLFRENHTHHAFMQRRADFKAGGVLLLECVTGHSAQIL
jgi:hypothetical protein